MRVLLLLAPLWAGAWVPGFHSPFTSGCRDNDPNYEIQVNGSVTVQEGLCVLVSCKLVKLPSSSWRGSVFSYWFRSGADTVHDSPVATNNPERAVREETRGRFHLLGDPKNHNCSLDIRDAQKRDGGSYFFRVEKGDIKWNFCRKPVSVQVTALTHTPHVDIPLTLEPGRAINLTCSVPWACERGTPPIFSWMSAALTSLGPRTTLSSVLTLTPRPQDHGTNLTCQVTFPGARVTVERTVQLSLTTPSARTKDRSDSEGQVRGDRAGNPGTAAVSGVVWGAIGGSGVTALLAICLAFFIVKTYRKRAVRAAVGMKPTHSPAVPGSQGQQQDPKSHSSADPGSSSGAVSVLDTEPEIHYASLSFHGSRAEKNT